MKNALPAIAVPLFALQLAGCGGEETATPPDESAAPQAEESAAPAVSTAKPEAADLAQAGRRAFTVCAVCHAAATDAPQRQGPNLYGVYGAPAARLPDYAYSKALQAAGFVWTDENLDAYIENPQKTVPGNKMAFAGVKDPEKRRAIIVYLESLTNDDAPDD